VLKLGHRHYGRFERPSRGEHSSLFGHSVVTKKKYSFVETDPRFFFQKSHRCLISNKSYSVTRLGHFWAVLGDFSLLGAFYVDDLFLFLGICTESFGPIFVLF
jgi:hypothetical protein